VNNNRVAERYSALAWRLQDQALTDPW
jgi:hypothetical protein